MRLFAAIELPEDVRLLLESAAQQLRVRLGRSVEARWVDQQKLHLTVRFIGHVEDDGAPALIDRVRVPIAVPPFHLRLSGCGVFPASGPPRVIWIGVVEGAMPLAQLHQELNRRVAPFGYEPERRPFSAHLTLARVKTAKSIASVRAAVRAFTTPDICCEVAQVTLFRSHLSPRGSRYEIVAAIPLVR
jgi:2'-5' RNA ligase